MSIHIFGSNSAKHRRMKVTDKMRNRFPECTCKTFEVHEYYDCFKAFHRPKCKWLMHGRKIKPRERLAWQTN